MSPSTSLCIAALNAATCATPPAPMISRFFFNWHETPFSSVAGQPLLGEAGGVIGVVETAYRFDVTVSSTNGNSRHCYTIEPVLLDHSVPPRVEKGHPVTHREGRWEV